MTNVIPFKPKPQAALGSEATDASLGTTNGSTECERDEETTKERNKKNKQREAEERRQANKKLLQQLKLGGSSQS